MALSLAAMQTAMRAAGGVLYFLEPVGHDSFLSSLRCLAFKGVHFETNKGDLLPEALIPYMNLTEFESFISNINEALISTQTCCTWGSRSPKIQLLLTIMNSTLVGKQVMWVHTIVDNDQRPMFVLCENPQYHVAVIVSGSAPTMSQIVPIRF